MRSDHRGWGAAAPNLQPDYKPVCAFVAGAVIALHVLPAFHEPDHYWLQPRENHHVHHVEPSTGGTVVYMPTSWQPL